TSCRAKIPPTITTTARICKNLKKLYQFTVSSISSGFLLAQCQLNRLLHRHGSSLSPERVEFSFREHGTQLCDCLIVFDTFRLCHRCLDSFAQGLCRATVFYGALRFLIVDGEKSKTLQLVCNSGAVTQILPASKSFSVDLICLIYISRMPGNVT